MRGGDTRSLAFHLRRAHREVHVRVPQPCYKCDLAGIIYLCVSTALGHRLFAGLLCRQHVLELLDELIGPCEEILTKYSNPDAKLTPT